MCDWLVENLGPDCPLHFSRFHPAHKLTNLPPTPVEVLLEARDIARQKRLALRLHRQCPRSGPIRDHVLPGCKRPVVERDLFFHRHDGHRGWQLQVLRDEDRRCLALTIHDLQEGFTVAAEKGNSAKRKPGRSCFVTTPMALRAWDNDTLPDEIIGKNGEPMNPRMHLSMHVIVEGQLASDEPQGVVAIARELEQLGFSRHDIRHEIGRVLAEDMWHILKEKRVFDKARYLADLRKAVESHR